MGSCVYYLKAYGCKEDDVEKIKSLLLELYEAENFWQDNRGFNDLIKKSLSHKEFWKQFDDKFPYVSKYLKFIKKFGKDYNNALAGFLDFGTDENVEDHLYLTSDDGDNCGELRYSAEVWHMSDWTGFTKFLKKEFGLKKVNWVSEEDMNPFDLI